MRKTPLRLAKKRGKFKINLFFVKADSFLNCICSKRSLKLTNCSGRSTRQATMTWTFQELPKSRLFLAVKKIDKCHSLASKKGALLRLRKKAIKSLLLALHCYRKDYFRIKITSKPLLFCALGRTKSKGLRSFIKVSKVYLSPG